ncbi:T9SS type A sorting domain-containing protein, partial [Spongiimicrobium sp. 3-5]|uniref:T9SS type A sorting domain-containing protein n=1 Tax=Spongiimicrobium sp. 3-5 TaxID=3332596 RepID=UPI00397EF56F
IGQYVLTTPTGCAAVINLNVVASCDSGDTPITAEYRINGVWDNGASQIVLDAGSDLIISALPNEVGGSQLGITITLPSGGTVGDDYNIAGVSEANEGTYIITSEEGCSVTLDVVVNPVDCAGLGLLTEYRINLEPWVQGASAVTVDEGVQLMLSVFPDDLPYTITGPNGFFENVGLGDFTIPNVTAIHDGIFTFTNIGSGCTVDLDVTVDVVDCSAVVSEHRINFDPWILDSPTATITEGAQLMLSIFPDDLPYTITGPNGFSENVGLGDFTIPNVTLLHDGIFTFTTIGSGCTVDLDVTVNPLDCGNVLSEYRVGITDPWTQGAPTAVVDEGDLVMLSVFPNDLPYTITGPNGFFENIGVGNYTFPSITPADSGIYTFTTIGTGCTVDLEVVVNVDCAALGLLTEYSVNGGIPVSGQSQLTVTEGDDLALSIIPDAKTFSVTGPNGNNKPLDANDLLITGSTIADSGTYTFTTEEGCSVVLELTVEPFDCVGLGLLTEYSVNGGIPVTGQTQLTATVGDDLALSIIPDAKAFSVTGPNGNSKALDINDLLITGSTVADSGTYTFTTEEGCSVVLELTIEPIDCIGLGLLVEYSVNGGTAVTGQSQLSVTEGDALSLGILPNGKAFSVTGPNGNNKALDLNDLEIASSVLADSGTYTFTTEEGCTTTLELTVTSVVCDQNSVTPEYAINDQPAQSGAGAITVNVGDSVDLGIVQEVPFTVTLPDGSVFDGEYFLENIELAQAGVYTFTIENGCTAVLVINVDTAAPCTATSIVASYTVDGESGNSESEITVFEDSEISLDAITENNPVTITLPGGEELLAPYAITAIGMEQAGLYTFTSDSGCTTTLNIVVLERQTQGVTPLKDLVVYPNPVPNGILNFVLTDYMGEGLQVQLNDIYGKTVLQHIIPSNHDNEEAWDVSGLSVGTYILIIERVDNNDVEFKKIIHLGL